MQYSLKQMTYSIDVVNSIMGTGCAQKPAASFHQDRSRPPKMDSNDEPGDWRDFIASSKECWNAFPGAHLQCAWPKIKSPDWLLETSPAASWEGWACWDSSPRN